MPSDLIDELQVRSADLSETILSGISALVTLCDEALAVEERLATVTAAKGDADRLAAIRALSLRGIRDHLALLQPDPDSFDIDAMFDAAEELIAQSTIVAKTTTDKET